MNDIRGDLKAFIDGQLPESRANEVEAAIASDANLQKEVQLMRILKAEIKKAGTDAPIEGASATVAKLRQQDESRMLAKLRLVPILGGLVLLVGVGAMIFPIFAQSRDEAMSDVAFSSPPLKKARPSDAQAEGGYLNGSRDAAKGNPGGAAGGSAEGGGGGYSGARNGLQLKTNDGRVIDRKTSTVTPSEAHKLLNQPQLIRTAEVTVKVESVQKSLSQISDLAKKLGGFLENTSSSFQEGRTPGAIMTFRVPVANFEAALIEIRNMGQIMAESSKSDDVTADVADKESRLQSYADEEKGLIDELARTRDQNLKFQIRNKLQQVRADLKSIKAQYAALRDVADFSTIHIQFVGRPQGEDGRVSAGWTDDTWTNATNSSRSIAKFFGAIGLYLLAYAPFWIPIAIVGWLVARRRRA